jgi:methionine-rich copper-binding protein CopC
VTRGRFSDAEPTRRALLRVALLGALLGALMSVAGTATAHSELRRSAPASGEVLSQPPERIELVFSERVQLTALRLYRVGGEEIALPRRAIRVADKETLALPPLGTGAYRVEWRIISADGHPVGGTITFRVEAPAGS